MARHLFNPKGHEPFLPFQMYLVGMICLKDRFKFDLPNICKE